MTEQKRIGSAAAGERAEPTLGRLLAARELRILGVVVLAALLLQFATPYFLTSSNLTAMLIGMVTDGLIAITMTVVLISGGFDLSVGSVLAFAGIVVATLLQQKVGIPIAITVTLLVGAAIGAANGLIITRARVNPLITTLGMMSIISSAALILSGGAPLASLPKSFFWLGQGRFGPVPVAVLLTIVLIVIADILLRRAQWMRLVYYVGGNEQAAFLSGIAVNRVRLLAYISSGIMAAVAGIISTSRLSSAFPLAGSGTELRVISACVIGGCSLAGGEGSVLGSILGVILVAIINNGLVLLKVPVYWQGIVTGAILIATVAFDMLNQRRLR